jgi:hypothetical protein
MSTATQTRLNAAQNSQPKQTVAPKADTPESLSKKTSEAIWKVFGSSNNLQGFFSQVIKILGEHFNSPFAVLAIESSVGNQQLTHSVSDEAANAWSKRCTGLLLDTRYRNLASARTIAETDSDRTYAILSCPLSVGSEGTVGAICVVVSNQDRYNYTIQLQELQAIVAYAGTMAVDVGAAPQKTTSAKSADTAAASRAAGYASLTEFAFAVVNNLKAKLGCESVSFGIVRKQRVQLVSMSGTSQADPSSLGTQQLQQVMEECVDAADICSIQVAKTGPEGVSTGHILHKQWHSDSAGASVASIPLQVDDKIVAVLSLRHTPHQSFTAEQLEKVREIATPLIPGALLLDRADRKLFEHAKTAVLDWCIEQLSNDTWIRRIVIGTILAAMCVALVGKQTYILTLPSSIAPADEREISSPFEGVIDSTLVRAGDTVTAGQLLVRLDTRQLKLDLSKSKSDFHAASIESMQGATEGDLQKLAIGKAKADAAQSLMRKIERNLELADVRAPCNGTILSGDLDKRIGESVPMGEPLLRFAAANNWKVVVEAPEFATTLIELGQAGTFATNARPGIPLNLEVNHIHTNAEIREGKNVFVSEGTLQGDAPEWLRSGMQGTAKIDVGRHPIYWVWVHRIIDQIRLKLWRI